MAYSNKMIKEDHLLACTTKMLEILVALPHQIRQTRSSRVTTWIVRTTQVHLSFRTHILAAIRLFTCQRAHPIQRPTSRRSSSPDFTANVAGNFRYRRRGSRSGVADISVSFGGVNRCREVFSVVSQAVLLGGWRRREARNRLIGSGPFEPS